MRGNSKLLTSHPLLEFPVKHWFHSEFMLDDSEVRLALARIRGINFAICELGRQIKTNASCVKSRNSDGSDGWIQTEIAAPFRCSCKPLDRFSLGRASVACRRCRRSLLGTEAAVNVFVATMCSTRADGPASRDFKFVRIGARPVETSFVNAGAVGV